MAHVCWVHLKRLCKDKHVERSSRAVRGPLSHEAHLWPQDCSEDWSGRLLWEWTCWAKVAVLKVPGSDSLLEAGLTHVSEAL